MKPQTRGARRRKRDRDESDDFQPSSDSEDDDDGDDGGSDGRAIRRGAATRGKREGVRQKPHQPHRRRNPAGDDGFIASEDDELYSERDGEYIESSEEEVVVPRHRRGRASSGARQRH